MCCKYDFHLPHHISSVQFISSVVSNSLWPHGLQHSRLLCPSPTLGVCSNSDTLGLIYIGRHIHWGHSHHLILYRPLLLLPSIFSSIRVFSNQSVLHIRWPKYGSFSFSISPSKVYSGLIFFSIDWLDLLAVQGTLKSLFQHHSSRASILRCSAFFVTQLSNLYKTAGKTIALSIQTCWQSGVSVF